MKVLFVNACISADHPSRTRRLCEAYLDRCRKEDAQITTLDLEKMNLKPFNEKMLVARNAQIEKKDYEHEMFAVAKALRRQTGSWWEHLTGICHFRQH